MPGKPVTESIRAKVGSVDQRFDRLEAKMDRRFDRLEAKIDRRFDEVMGSINELIRIGTLEHRQ